MQPMIATLLGKNVVFNLWGCGLSDEQTAWVRQRFAQAFALIDAHADKLSPGLREAIGAVGTIVVPLTNSVDLGASGVDGATLSLPYLQDCSVAWLASLIAHEGQHHRNHGAFTGSDLWRHEQGACLSQLALGNLIVL